MTARFSLTVYTIIILGIISFTLAGCATILKGSKEEVSFISEPTGAKVYSDGVLIGTTPMLKSTSKADKSNSPSGPWNRRKPEKDTTSTGTSSGVMLSTRRSHVFEFKKDGYETKTVFLPSSASGGYIILDILFGLWPALIDGATGAWNTFDRDVVGATLDKK